MLGNLAGSSAPELPDTRERPVNLVVRVGRIVRQLLPVDPQAAGHRFADHPAQGDVGQAALGVPAAYVRMNPGKPHLLDGLARRGIALVPQARRKIAASLVDGEGVVAVGDVGIQPGIVKAFAGVHRQRLHGIPHADEVHRAAPAEVGAEAPRHGVIGRVVDFRGVFHQVAGVLAEQAAGVEHAGQRAHGEGAAAEAEEIHGVAVFVAAHQVAVGILDVLLQPVAGRLVGQGLQAAARFVVFPAAGADAGVVIGRLRRVLLRQYVGLHDVGVVASVFVAGAVAADDDVFHVLLLSPCRGADGLRQ